MGGWKWSFVLSSRKEKQFKDSLKWLLISIKKKRGVSQDQIIVDFCEYIEKETGERISPEAFHAYLGGRANFPISLSFYFLSFLADGDGGKRRKYSEVLEFVQEWYFPMIPLLQKFISAGQELKRELEEKARQFDYKFRLD